MNSGAKPSPVIFIIFGGTGDLSYRKLAPALYNLFIEGWLPEQFAIIGTGRSTFSNEEFAAKIHDGINNFSRSGKAADDKWDAFSKHIAYQSADIKDAAAYQAFGAAIEKYNAEWQTEANIVYYLAVSPGFSPSLQKILQKINWLKILIKRGL